MSLIKVVELMGTSRESWDDSVRQIVSEAAEFAQSDPEPDPSALWTDVYLPA